MACSWDVLNIALTDDIIYLKYVGHWHMYYIIMYLYVLFNILRYYTY